MWYVIKTPSGKEENMMHLVENTLDKSTYGRCFIPRAEYVWRKQGKSNIDIETLFDGYIFIEADQPEQLFARLKILPGVVWRLPDGREDADYTFQQVHEEDERFLRNMLLEDPEYTVRLSYIHRDENKRIDRVDGPLEFYRDRIVSVDYRHRRVFAEVPLFGKVQRIKFCVRTDEDVPDSADAGSGKDAPDAGFGKNAPDAMAGKDAPDMGSVHDVLVNTGD